MKEATVEVVCEDTDSVCRRLQEVVLASIVSAAGYCAVAAADAFVAVC